MKGEASVNGEATRVLVPQGNLGESRRGGEEVGGGECNSDGGGDGGELRGSRGP